MHTLLWILSSCFIGGLLSVITAAIVTLYTRIHLVSHLVSYAVGAMLGAVFLEILPHAFKLTNNIETTTFVVLFGILLFFALEKLLLWRHCHGDHCEVHDLHHEDPVSKTISFSKLKSSLIESINVLHCFLLISYPLFSLSKSEICFLI